MNTYPNEYVSLLSGNPTSRNSYKITQIFDHYDRNRSETIDSNEFNNLVRDLFMLRDARIPSNAAAISNEIFRTITTRQSMSLSEFIAAANGANGGILRVLLAPDFVPSYERQLLPPWEVI